MRPDSQQHPVIHHEAGHLLVIAGAGSGKTTTMIARTARRLANGADPRRTVMTTFTNKAAREMNDRLASILPDTVGRAGIFIGTQHRFGMRLIRHYREECGVANGFSLLDPGDADLAQKDLLLDLGAQKEESDAYLRSMAWLSNEGVLPDDPNPSVPALERAPREWKLCDPRSVHEARQRYDQWKREHNLLDLDDLMLRPLALVQRNQGVRGALAAWFDEIVIDEAQDLNGAQFDLWLTLAEVPDGPRLILVGDDDQAIYRWRDARPEHLHRFLRVLNAQTLNLERNYRSGHRIVESAGACIRNNPARLPKSVTPAREQAGEVTLGQYADSAQIGTQVAQSIRARLITDPAARVAVLYRTHRLRAVVEDDLVRLGIPYHVKDGTSLLERAEPRMMLAILRLAVNPQDAPAFARAAAILPGIGEKTAARLCAVPNGPLSDAALTAAGKKAPVLDAFRRDLRDLSSAGPQTLPQWLARQEGFSEFVRKLAQRTAKDKATRTSVARRTDPGSEGAPPGFNESLSRSVDRIARVGRLLQEFVQAGIAEEPQADPWEIAMGFLEGGLGAEADPPVVLCTIHGAKGLEWDDVHVIGFSEGLMPLISSGADEPADPNEERCLAYVAMTRAKNRLFLHHARFYSLPGMNLGMTQVSRYAKEAGLLARRAAAPEPPAQSPRDNVVSLRKFLEERARSGSTPR